MRLIDWNCLILIASIVIGDSNGQLNQITIGAVFEDDTFFNESIQMLQYAVYEANDKILQDSGMRLAIESEIIAYGREYAVSKRVCNLLELGVGVLFGPRSISSAFHAMNICDAKEIPYINTYMDEDAVSKFTVLNMHPNLNTLTQLLLDYVNASNWKTITILYESPLWLRRVANILEINNPSRNRINVRNLDYTTNNEFRPTLQDVRDADETNIILECSTESLPIILRQAMQVGLMTKHFRWILTNLDTHSIDLEPYQYNGANITTFRILDSNHAIFNLRPTTQEDDNEDLFNVDPESRRNANGNQLGDDKCNSNTVDRLIPVYPEKLNDVVSLRVQLIYDAVMVFAKAIQQLGSDQVIPVPVMCTDPDSVWNKGYTIINYLKNVKYDGLSGKIEFDNNGIWSNFTVDILELGENGLDKIGSWMQDIDNPTKRLKIKRNPIELFEKKIDDNSLRNKTLKIITALADPYTMLKLEAESLTGNDRFEGYAIDLIFELSLLLEFSYEFIVETDGEYGELVDKNRNEWNGMIGKVMSGEADLAITDLTVTSERIKALEFTPSIMNLGIAILYQIPRKQAPSTFSFMAPFGNDVWFLLGITYLSVSVCFFLLGRISPSQWENPCDIHEAKFLHNQFSFANSLWFAAGAILQQGSEIEVKAASVRLASAAWWFFTMIIVSSYTANLAAFLVAESRVTVIESVEDFKACGKEGQPKCKASFGAKRHGSTLKFFEDSQYPTYKNMYEVMMEHKDEVLVDSNLEGLRKAQTENYAFLMESTTLLYYTERNCNVTMVGDLIDDRTYAIGMRKGYKYYHALSEGVLRLQERGVFDKLHTKWWKAKRGGGACQKPESTEAESLDYNHLEGVFIVLTYGSFFALIYGIITTVWSIHNRAREAKISFRQELKTEARFLLKSLADPNRPKPVRFCKKQLSSIQLTKLNSSNPACDK